MITVTAMISQSWTHESCQGRSLLVLVNMYDRMKVCITDFALRITPWRWYSCRCCSIVSLSNPTNAAVSHHYTTVPQLWRQRLFFVAVVVNTTTTRQRCRCRHHLVIIISLSFSTDSSLFGRLVDGSFLWCYTPPLSQSTKHGPVPSKEGVCAPGTWDEQREWSTRLVVVEVV